MNPNSFVWGEWTDLLLDFSESLKIECGHFSLSNLLFQCALNYFLLKAQFLKSNETFMSFFVFFSPPEFLPLFTVSQLCIVENPKVPLVNLCTLI